MRLLSAVPLIAVSVLALAACTGGGEIESSSGAPVPPAPTVTIAVTVTPEPPAPTTRPDFGFTFFEEAQLGQSFDQASAALRMPLAGLDECPYYGPVWITQLATTYAFTDFDNPNGPITLFYAQQFLGSPSDSWPRNAEGVGLGSTQAEILAAYPDAVVGAMTDLGAGDITTITVADPDSDSKYVFGITSGAPAVDLLQWGANAGGQWSHLCGGF